MTSWRSPAANSDTQAEFAGILEDPAASKSFPAFVWQAVMISQAAWSSRIVMAFGAFHLQIKSAQKQSLE